MQAFISCHKICVSMEEKKGCISTFSEIIRSALFRVTKYYLIMVKLQCKYQHFKTKISKTQEEKKKRKTQPCLRDILH